MRNKPGIEGVVDSSDVATVAAEVKAAYVTGSTMMFRASLAVNRDQACAIMRAYVPGYNEFEPDLLLHLAADAQVTLAREYSVCVYVKGKVRKSSKFCTDEFDYYADKDETRLWWD